MEEKEKYVWIDEKKRVLAFHPFEEAKLVEKEENSFWSFVFMMTYAGYRIM